jgi:hypothetical protein
MAKYTQSQMNILIKIIAAVETGGQIYGQARYDDYTPAYANCSNETSCTIGAFQEYGSLAKGLLQEILNTYPTTFRKYDNAGIESDLQRASWTGYSPARGSAKAKAIQAIISSPDGIKVQNNRIQKQMESHIAFAQKQGVSDVDALFMCANFIHQGGQSACTRILKKTQKPYTLDHLYAACKTDTGNQVGAYKTRQQKVYGWLKEKISNKNISNNNSNNTLQGSDNMTTEKAINALIATAQAEIGYMEKKSNAQLDDKTANVGDGNYTKYWRDLKPSWNGSAWCAVWVSWCMYKTFGLETAKKLLKHENDFPYVYCPTLGARFTKYANPQRGDIVIFYRNGTFAHTGIVTKVEGDKFYTIEGNTNNGSTIIANGGSVCSKSYNNSNLPGTKFCRPDYSIVKSIMNSSSTSKPSTSTYKKWVGAATKDGTDVFANPTGTSKLSTYPKLNKDNLVDVIGVSGTRYQVKIADKFVGYVEKTNIKDPNAVVTKPSASTSKPKYPFVGEVTASELNVRTGAGTNYGKLSSYPILKRGNLVDVLKAKKDTSGNKWYQVRIAGKYTGYVSAQYIKKK